MDPMQKKVKKKPCEGAAWDHRSPENEQYFLADIHTQFHSGEAIVKLNMAENTWLCLFTLRDRIVAAIYGVHIDEKSLVRIIKEQNLDTFAEYVLGNCPVHNANR
jgi:hypothetical protein